MAEGKLKISVLTREFIRVRVEATDNGIPVDLGNYPVEFAFPDRGVDPTTWSSGSWETEGPDFFARCLVGPGGAAVLSVGTYDIWLRFTGQPEVPVRHVGSLVVE